MRRTAVGVAAILATLAVIPARGADLPPKVYTKAPPVYRPFVAPFTWQGFYVGLNGGYGWGSSTLTGVTGSSTVDPQGGLFGSTFGYNFLAGGIVFGIEGDLDYSWMQKTNDAVAPCANCEVRNRYLATARARLGYAYDRWLPYITGGAAFGDIEFSTPAGGGQSIDKVGWTVGGGVEYAFAGSNWSTKLEYLYADLGTATCDATHCGASTDADFHANIVRVGVNYRY